MRIALGLSYDGSSYSGWQTQPQGTGLQDALEYALARFCDMPDVSADAPAAPEAVRPPAPVPSHKRASRIPTVCSGRTDSGVHSLQQVVHFEAPVTRREFSWVLGVNRFLPATMAVQWAREVPPAFDARFSALCRRYRYWLYCARVRPSLGHGRVGWLHTAPDLDLMQQATPLLVGEHDFSAFRSSDCQARSPVRNLQSIDIRVQESFMVFDFVANAFLHHMVRNLMGSLIQVGLGKHPPEWIGRVLESRSRELAAPTFMPDGLYFLGAEYPESFGLPPPPDPTLPLI